MWSEQHTKKPCCCFVNCKSTPVMCRLVLLIVETLTLMLRESDIFSCRMTSLKTDDGAVLKQLITLLVKRPINVEHLTGNEQVRQPVTGVYSVRKQQFCLHLFVVVITYVAVLAISLNCGCNAPLPLWLSIGCPSQSDLPINLWNFQT